ncbi:MAG: S24 family peptidase [Campylobacterales bacterium]|nr:S24 family peptidase [Campylobacterales bacterium]
MDTEQLLRMMVKQGGFKSQKAFSDWAGVSESYITKWKKQGYIPQEILSRYKSEFGELFESSPSVADSGKSDLINIPYYKDVSAAAGCGVINHCAETEIIKMSKSFLTAVYGLVTFTGLEALNVAGESMAPQLSDGDIIIVLKDAPIVQGGIYVVVWHGEAMVKRVQRNPKTGAVRLISDNPICDSYTVEDDDLENLRIVGQVVAHMVRTK